MRYRYQGEGPVDVPELGKHDVAKGDVVEATGALAASLEKSPVWAREASRRKKKAPNQGGKPTEQETTS